MGRNSRNNLRARLSKARWGVKKRTKYTVIIDSKSEREEMERVLVSEKRCIDYSRREGSMSLCGRNAVVWYEGHAYCRYCIKGFCCSVRVSRIYTAIKTDTEYIIWKEKYGG